MQKKIIFLLLFLVVLPVVANNEQKHIEIRKKFLTLQAQYGLQTNPNPKIFARSVTGRQGADQAGFNAIRKELYTLLTQPVLTDADVKNITQKITDFKATNPARWPQPKDYKELLNFRTSLEGLLKDLQNALNQLTAAL